MQTEIISSLRYEVRGLRFEVRGARKLNRDFLIPFFKSFIGKEVRSTRVEVRGSWPIPLITFFKSFILISFCMAL